MGAILRGHVNIRNGHYVLLICKTTMPVKTSFKHVSIDISVIINNQEMLPNLMFYKNYSTYDAGMRHMK